MHFAPSIPKRVWKDRIVRAIEQIVGLPVEDLDTSLYGRYLNMDEEEVVDVLELAGCPDHVVENLRAGLKERELGLVDEDKDRLYLVGVNTVRDLAEFLRSNCGGAVYDDEIKKTGKRTKHVMVRGGRDALRLKSVQDVPQMGQDAKQRLEGAAPPYEARTQSTSSHKRAEERMVAGLAKRIEEAVYLHHAQQASSPKRIAAAARKIVANSSHLLDPTQVVEARKAAAVALSKSLEDLHAGMTAKVTDDVLDALSPFIPPLRKKDESKRHLWGNIYSVVEGIEDSMKMRDNTVRAPTHYLQLVRLGIPKTAALTFIRLYGGKDLMLDPPSEDIESLYPVMGLEEALGGAAVVVGSTGVMEAEEKKVAMLRLDKVDLRRVSKRVEGPFMQLVKQVRLDAAAKRREKLIPDEVVDLRRMALHAPSGRSVALVPHDLTAVNKQLEKAMSSEEQDGRGRTVVLWLGPAGETEIRVPVAQIAEEVKKLRKSHERYTVRAVALDTARKAVARKAKRINRKLDRLS